MQTTKQWTDKVLTSPQEFNHWLTRQYVGESLAADNIEQLAKTSEASKHAKALLRIAKDEAKHRDWVAGLLKTRGIDLPEVNYDSDRYWKPILVDNDPLSFKELAAVGHHAETMRLGRIDAIANDLRFPEDVREVFKNIYDDEVFHAAAFKAMSDDPTIEEMRKHHEAGLTALGLEI